MKSLAAVVLGVLALGLAGSVNAQDDNTKKIVGKWEVVKGGGDLPAGTTIEFTADGDLLATIKVDNDTAKIKGKYKIDKERLVVTITVGDMKIEETSTIVKLDAANLEVKDKDGKVDVLKKK